MDKETFKSNLELKAPNKLYEALGQRHVFSGVARSERPDPAAADFIISGEYEFIFRAGRGLTRPAVSLNVRCRIIVNWLRNFPGAIRVGCMKTTKA